MQVTSARGFRWKPPKAEKTGYNVGEVQEDDMSNIVSKLTDGYKKQGKRGKILYVALALLVLCCVCSVPVALLNPGTQASKDTNQPEAIPTFGDIPTNTPEPPPTETSPSSKVDEYMAEYGGNPDAYLEILLLTDCNQLQEKFDIASANNSRETAGTDAFKWTLGYMTAANDRMTEIGCYKE